MRTSSLSTQLAWRLTLSASYSDVLDRTSNVVVSRREGALGTQRFWAMDGNRKVTRFSVYHVFILRHLFTFSIFSLVELVGLKIWKKLLSWYAKCSLVFPSRGLKNVACLSSQLFHRGSQRNVSKWKSLVWDAQRVLESFFRGGGGTY